MENIPVTTYRGFSAVSGETTFTQDMADIRNGKHAKLIIKIASLVAQGKVEEANHVKKQLPFRTLTANYRERRLAPSITRYNPVITLDMGKPTEVTSLRYTLGAGAEGSAIGDYRIETSLDGENYTLIKEGALSLDKDGRASLYFDNGKDPWI